jgi:hypothetical protein
MTANLHFNVSLDVRCQRTVTVGLRTIIRTGQV